MEVCGLSLCVSLSLCSAVGCTETLVGEVGKRKEFEGGRGWVVVSVEVTRNEINAPTDMNLTFQILSSRSIHTSPKVFQSPEPGTGLWPPYLFKLPHFLSQRRSPPSSYLLYCSFLGETQRQLLVICTTHWLIPMSPNVIKLKY